MSSWILATLIKSELMLALTGVIVLGDRLWRNGLDKPAVLMGVIVLSWSWCSTSAMLKRWHAQEAEEEVEGHRRDYWI
jgi:hypothetical protein